jgi:hypothetical protein
MYEQDLLSDVIALYALYLPVIRYQVQSFVQTWNMHRIRKQKNRPGLPYGQPNVLYHHPAEGTCRQGYTPNLDAVDELRNELGEWGK